MNTGALRALEFDRIVEAVCRFALTPGGAARLQRLSRMTESAAVRDALAATSETVRFLDSSDVELQAPANLDGDSRRARR